MNILVTGAAGFVGFHAAQRLLALGHSVVGIDNLNDYYDPALKLARLKHLENCAGWTFVKGDIADRPGMAALFETHKPQRVLHLGAQAGVRYSLQNPHAYADSNLTGFVNVLEGCRHGGVEHLVFASSSSVYGANRKVPFSAKDATNHPISLYAATKKANELMAHSYSHLFRLPVTGLRFFTVYGPWGRPDMAYFLFTRAIIEGRPIDIFNEGRLARDFTYIDDIVEGVLRVLDRPAQPDPDWSPLDPSAATSNAPYRVYNIGNSAPVPLMRFVNALETSIGRTAIKNFKPMQPGDVLETHADTADLEADIRFAPHTPLEEGIERFVRWYRSYYAV
jgi:UDP-glucuronate 4-epimerase